MLQPTISKTVSTFFKPSTKANWLALSLFITCFASFKKFLRGKQYVSLGT